MEEAYYEQNEYDAQQEEAEFEQEKQELMDYELDNPMYPDK